MATITRRDVTIEVTEQDIAEGTPANAHQCPVALATRRAFPDAHIVLVSGMGITVRGPGYRCENNWVPFAIRDFIRKFDVRMTREVKHGFQVMVGSAPTLWPSLLMGACGAILAYANAAPYSTIAIWEAYRTREDAAGLDWQNRIGRAAALVTSKYGVPGLKYAMDLNGYYGGPPRLPLCVPSPAAKKEIEEAFRDLKG